jgi:hypothetical protein
MPTYISLISYTDQGIKNIKDSPKRLEATKKALAATGRGSESLLHDAGRLRRRPGLRRTKRNGAHDVSPQDRRRRQCADDQPAGVPRGRVQKAHRGALEEVNTTADRACLGWIRVVRPEENAGSRRVFYCGPFGREPSDGPQ